MDKNNEQERMEIVAYNVVDSRLRKRQLQPNGTPVKHISSKLKKIKEINILHHFTKYQEQQQHNIYLARHS